MTRSSSRLALKSSPHSSEPSCHGTPSTNLTAFSPETARTTTEPRPKFNIVVAQADGSIVREQSIDAKTFEVDPFINAPTPTSARSTLSPTAAEFTPGQKIVPGRGGPSTTNALSYRSSGIARGVAAGAPVTHGRARIGAIGDELLGTIDTLADQLHNTGLVNARAPGQRFRDATIHEGIFTSDGATTRAFLIEGVARNTPFVSVANQFNITMYGSLDCLNASALGEHGVVCVGFTDYRDAEHAFMATKISRPDWRLTRLAPKAYALKKGDGATTNAVRVTDFESQVVVSVFFNQHDPNIEAASTFQLVKQALSSFGDIKAIHSLPHEQGNVRDIRVEFFDTKAAFLAVQSLREVQLGPVVLSIEQYKPDVPSTQVPTMQLSLTGRSTIPIDDPAGSLAYPFTSRPTRHSHHSSSPHHRSGRYDVNGSHNQVDIGRIQRGLDVRTTIMLRNIPNKVDQAMLKKILDETSHGAYDFVYLRIDFANNCNVGYAFINFIDALAIIPFALARAGQRWNRFNSDKVAEISYATIQGRDCLVQKFRNSSVMLEHPTFRPKLYIAGSSPDAGQEEPFPHPDNPSKMRRSVENAEHVGLFRPGRKPFPSRRRHGYPAGRKTLPSRRRRTYPPAQASIALDDGGYFSPSSSNNSNYTSLFAPRQGQAYREEQRRRRSQFDRGTFQAHIEAYEHYMADPRTAPFPSHDEWYHGKLATLLGDDYIDIMEGDVGPLHTGHLAAEPQADLQPRVNAIFKDMVTQGFNNRWHHQTGLDNGASA